MSTAPEPDNIVIDFDHCDPDSKIKSITLNKGANHSHGSAGSIIVEPREGSVESAEFWQKMNDRYRTASVKTDGVVMTLNLTPPDYPKNPNEMTPAELRPRGNDFDYPNFKGSHHLGGCENAYIDSVPIDDLPNVAAKAVRQMGMNGLLTEKQVAYAHDMLALPMPKLPAMTRG